MTAPEREALGTGLDSMARQIESALDYDVAKRRQEGLETTPDTHLMSPPSWPSHGCLRHWIKALDEARKLLSAAPAVTVTEGWKPIETAPDDEPILVHYDNDEIQLIECDGDGFERQPYDGKNECSMGISKPTHWHPLPPPPSTTPQTGSQE